MWVFKEVNIIAVKVNCKLAFYLNVPVKKGLPSPCSGHGIVSDPGGESDSVEEGVQ